MTYIVLSVNMFHDMTLPYCKSVLSWSGVSCDYGVSRVAKQVHQVHEASTYGPRTQSGDLPPLPSMRGCDWEKPVSHPLHVGYIFTPQFHVYGSIQISRVMQEGRNKSCAVSSGKSCVRGLTHFLSLSSPLLKLEKFRPLAFLVNFCFVIGGNVYERWLCFNDMETDKYSFQMVRLFVLNSSDKNRKKNRRKIL